MLINNVRGWLRAEGLKIRSGASKDFPARVREIGDLPAYVESQLLVLDSLNEQIAAADGRIEKLAGDDELCVRLMTVPGIGRQTAVRFAATVDDISRFKDAHKLESYLGLVPGEYSSADKRHRLSITKAGSSSMRYLLVQASWAIRTRCKSHDARPLQFWLHEVEKRRGRHVAVVALARKLAGILFALWRDGTDFTSALSTATR